MVSAMKNSGSRLLMLVNDLLDTATMQHRGLELMEEPVDVRAVLDEVLPVQVVLMSGAVKLADHVPKGLPPVIGDASRITQIFHNLVGALHCQSAAPWVPPLLLRRTGPREY